MNHIFTKATCIYIVQYIQCILEYTESYVIIHQIHIYICLDACATNIVRTPYDVRHTCKCVHYTLCACMRSCMYTIMIHTCMNVHDVQCTLCTACDRVRRTGYVPTYDVPQNAYAYVPGFAVRMCGCYYVYMACCVRSFIYIVRPTLQVLQCTTFLQCTNSSAYTLTITYIRYDVGCMIYSISHTLCNQYLFIIDIDIIYFKSKCYLVINKTIYNLFFSIYSLDFYL